jgi:histidyl-tRNA synthetase
MEIRAVRGMHDLYGEELALWQWTENELRKVLSSFGFKEIRTPVLEQLSVFKETVGDETDIVEKQMYTIEKESETLVLRPEGTSGFIRAVLEHQLHRLPGTQRYYYYQPMFRHERPQKGRLRQFFQVGAEIINDSSPEADAELIALLDAIYKHFQITEYKVCINSVGCKDCRPQYKEKLKDYFRPHLASLCELCQKRFERSPLRILDCKRESCKALAEKAPVITNSLCSVCQGHHSKVRSRLKDAKVDFIDDPSIVRGLDYYSRTAFEFTSVLLGAQSALGGGGRYDELSTRFGAEPLPAVGFGLGMERLVMVLQEMKKHTPPKETPFVFLAPLGVEAFNHLFSIGIELKRVGISNEMVYDAEKGLKALLKAANRVEAAYAIVLGDDELKSGQFLLKDMKAGTQESLKLSHIKEELLGRRQRAS